MNLIDNKRGQAIFYTFMLGVVVIVLALALASPVKQFVDNARNVSSDTQVGLDCGNSSISMFDKGTCTFVDLGLPYFIFGLIGIAGIIIGARVVFG